MYFYVQFSNSCRPTSRILDYANIVFEIKTVMHSLIIADTVRTLLVFRDIVVMFFSKQNVKVEVQRSHFDGVGTVVVIDDEFATGGELPPVHTCRY